MIEIFPAIDIIEGKVVRLREGSFDKRTEYTPTPLSLACRYADGGFRNLHLVDLDGARTGSIRNLAVIEEITGKTSLRVDFGGGLRSEEDIEQAFFAGVWKMNVGSVAVRSPMMLRQWMMNYGAERFIAAVDLRGEIPTVYGWQQEAEISWESLIEELVNIGVMYISVTAIQRDGNMQGTDMTLYRKIRKTFPEIKLIAGGGISSVEEIGELEKTGVWGVILGKALLEGKISIEQIKKFL